MGRQDTLRKMVLSRETGLVFILGKAAKHQGDIRVCQVHIFQADNLSLS